MVYIIHPHGQPAQVLTGEDLARNAREQRAAGIAPAYRFIYDFKRNEYSRPGYLVYSTYHDGACIVILDATGNAMQIIRGWQGEFCFSISDGDEEDKTA